MTQTRKSTVDQAHDRGGLLLMGHWPELGLVSSTLLALTVKHRLSVSEHQSRKKRLPK